MINNNSEAGAHSSIMINAPSQRVIFDPAGSVRAKYLVESDDVLYGITPRIEDFYERAHARETYRVRIQRIEVPADEDSIEAQSPAALPSAQTATRESLPFSKVADATSAGTSPSSVPNPSAPWRSYLIHSVIFDVSPRISRYAAGCAGPWLVIRLPDRGADSNQPKSRHANKRDDAAQ